METSRHTGMGRREFLLLSSVSALATAAVGPKLFAGEAAQPQRLAIGFAGLAGGALFAASSIPSSDGGFISRGARISISGGGSVAEPGARRAVELLAHFSYLEGAERRTTPFRAWASNRLGATGNSINFRMPVADEQAVRFSVTSERMAGGSAVTRKLGISEGARIESKELPVALTLRNEPGALNLVRGVYVIVPLFEGDSEPRWSSLEVQDKRGRATVHVRGDESAAALEHFVLRVDYATV